MNSKGSQGQHQKLTQVFNNPSFCIIMFIINIIDINMRDPLLKTRSLYTSPHLGSHYHKHQRIPKKIVFLVLPLSTQSYIFQDVGVCVFDDNVFPLLLLLLLMMISLLPSHVLGLLLLVIGPLEESGVVCHQSEGDTHDTT